MKDLAERWRRLISPAQPGDGDGSPLWRPGDPRAVLCLHGLTGTPFEVRPLAEAIAGRGFSVHAPVLAGHGRQATDLAATRWTDWLASARAAADRLRDHTGHPALAIVGFSTGGLLALRLALERPEDVRALVLISTPLRMKRHQTTGIRALAALPRFMRVGPLDNVPKNGGSDVVDEDVRRKVPSLTVMPVPALASLLDLMDVVRPELSRIKAPALVVHGLKDRTIPLEDSLEIAGSLGSDTIDRLWLEQSGHLACVDIEKHHLQSAALRFLDRYMPSSGSATPVP